MCPNCRSRLSPLLTLLFLSGTSVRGRRGALRQDNNKKSEAKTCFPPDDPRLALISGSLIFVHLQAHCDPYW